MTICCRRLHLLVVLTIIDITSSTSSSTNRHHHFFKLRRGGFKHKHQGPKPVEATARLPLHAVTLYSGESNTLQRDKAGKSGNNRRLPNKPEITLRPHHGGSAEKISCGIYVMDIFEIKMKTGTWNADIVITVKWDDSRTKSLLPPGKHEAHISEDEVEKNLWTPGIAVTNTYLDNSNRVSSMVHISQNGTVTQILRITAEMTTLFNVRAFPFDSQKLSVRIASEALMSDQLELVAMDDPASTGLAEELLQDFDFELKYWNMKTFVEQDGLLKKSRGQMTLGVQRQSYQYIQQLLIPELLILVMSWATFWFPLAPAFAMPRVATALISFLSLMTLSLRTNSLLPARGGMCWMDLFEEACEALMFCNMVMNIMVEVIYHTFSKQTLAQDIDHQLKIIIPCVTGITFFITYWDTDGSSLEFYAFITVFIIMVTFSAFTLICLYRVKTRVAEDMRRDSLRSLDSQKSLS